MRTLLIDTCGDNPSIALTEGSAVVASAVLPSRSASGSLMSAITTALDSIGWKRNHLTGIGVVNGPGSFTGVRVGLSCAKGLCEALGISIAVVSRLRVLGAFTKPHSGYVALSAGRGEVFAMDVDAGREFLEGIGAFNERVSGARVATCEEQLFSKITGAVLELHEMTAASSLPLVMERLATGGDDIALADANYVRSEEQIYGRAPSISSATQ